MSLLKKIKNFFYNKSLKNTLSAMPVLPREMVNLNTAKHIGILYKATLSDEIMVISQFAEKLKAEGKEVHILGFKDEKSKEDTSPKVFNRNSVNWYGIPTDEKIDGFQKLNLDILISAYKDECLPLEFIAATSKAKFRVGAFSQNKTNNYELMINVDNKSELLYLLQQIFHFLKGINKDEK